MPEYDTSLFVVVKTETSLLAGFDGDGTDNNSTGAGFNMEVT